MRIFFNFIKNCLRKLDGYWIENAGHPIIVKGIFKNVEDNKKYEACYPVVLYGFYDYPQGREFTLFGINVPDDLVIQFNADVSISIGTMLSVEGFNWVVVNKTWVYNRFIGKYRLQVYCEQYHENVIEVDEE